MYFVDATHALGKKDASRDALLCPIFRFVYIKTLSLKILEKSKETQGRGKDRQKTPQDEGFSLPTYKEMGITLNLASESQRLAELP